MRKREKIHTVLTNVNTPIYLIPGTQQKPVKTIAAVTAGVFSFSLTRAAKQVYINARQFLDIVLGTSIYVFAFGCALNWLNPDHRIVRVTSLALIFFFLIAGILLGKYHFEKTFKYLNAMAVFLV
jgi:hypothetical protein